MADVVRICGRGVQYRHVCNEDNDSPARCEHDVQCAIHRLRILLRNLPHAYLEPDSSAVEHGTATADAEADSRCGSRGILWRNLDGLAKAVHDPARFSQGGHRL